MNAKETVLNIFNQLDDKQLKEFIDIFSEKTNNTLSDEEKLRRDRTFENLMKMRKHSPDFDEKAKKQKT